MFQYFSAFAISYSSVVVIEFQQSNTANRLPWIAPFGKGSIHSEEYLDADVNDYEKYIFSLQVVSLQLN